MACTIITVHCHPCIKFLSTQILEPPSQLTVHSQPATEPVCTRLQLSGHKSIRPSPRGYCFHKNRHFWLFLCSLTIWISGLPPVRREIRCHEITLKCKDNQCQATRHYAIWLTLQFKVLLSTFSAFQYAWICRFSQGRLNRETQLYPWRGY